MKKSFLVVLSLVVLTLSIPSTYAQCQGSCEGKKKDKTAESSKEKDSSDKKDKPSA